MLGPTKIIAHEENAVRPCWILFTKSTQLFSCSEETEKAFWCTYWLWKALFKHVVEHADNTSRANATGKHARAPTHTNTENMRTSYSDLDEQIVLGIVFDAISMASMMPLQLRPLGIRARDTRAQQVGAPIPASVVDSGGSTSSRSSLSSRCSRSWSNHIMMGSFAAVSLATWRARRSSCIRSQIVRQGTLAKPGDAETPGNATEAIEEWLLSLDLPTPLKPILGSGAWASFAASLVQMFVVAGLSALGTLIEQGEAPAFYAQKYPESSGIILMLGFDHMYSCPLFLGLLAWLAASLIACTGTTQLPLAKRAQRFTFHSSAAMKRRGTFLMRMNCPALGDGVQVPGSAERLQQLRTELKNKGFIVRADDDINPTQLAASRGLLGKFAPMAVHLALLLTLLGNTVGLVFGSSSEVLVGDGGYADIGKVLDAGRRIKGPLAVLSPNKGLLDSVFVRVDDFRIESLSCSLQKAFWNLLDMSSLW